MILHNANVVTNIRYHYYTKWLFGQAYSNFFKTPKSKNKPNKTPHKSWDYAM